MHFENLLNALLGEREVFHVMECQVCGFDEVYYKNPYNGEQIGRACKKCQFVQKFDFNKKSERTPQYSSILR